MGLGQGLRKMLRKQLLHAWALPGTIVVIATAVLLFGDDAATALRYDRAAIAASEFVRLVSGRLVVFHQTHFEDDRNPFPFEAVLLSRGASLVRLSLVGNEERVSGVELIMVLAFLAQTLVLRVLPDRFPEQAVFLGNARETFFGPNLVNASFTHDLDRFVLL